MRRRYGGYVVAAALAVLAVGCTPPSSPPATTPTPTVPSVTPTPSPSENATERQMRLDQEAAERAYLAVTREGNRLAMAGGASRPTAILIAGATDEYLAFLMRDLGELRKNGWRTDRATTVSVTANRGWSPTEIGLTSCENASEVRLIDQSGKEVGMTRPRFFVQTLTAVKTDQRWKIASVDTRVVKSLDGEAGCEKV